MNDPTPTIDAPSKPPQRFRRIRIAVSVFFGVLTVALCVMWVRSFHKIDQVHFQVRDNQCIRYSSTGNVAFIGYQKLNDSSNGWWRHGTYELPRKYQGDPDPDWWFTTRSHRTEFGVPFWFPVTLAVGFTATPWLSYSNRFSLRTMLIATTLVAVVLGLGVWLFR